MLTPIHSSNRLGNYIVNLIVAFQQDADIDYDIVLSQLERFRNSVQTLARKYTIEPPATLVDFYETMLVVCEHNLNALTNLEEFLDDDDEELLRQAYLEAAAGDQGADSGVW